VEHLELRGNEIDRSTAKEMRIFKTKHKE